MTDCTSRLPLGKLVPLHWSNPADNMSSHLPSGKITRCHIQWPIVPLFNFFLATSCTQTMEKPFHREELAWQEFPVSTSCKNRRGSAKPPSPPLTHPAEELDEEDERTGLILKILKQMSKNNVSYRCASLFSRIVNRNFSGSFHPLSSFIICNKLASTPWSLTHCKREYSIASSPLLHFQFVHQKFALIYWCFSR